MKSFLKTIQKVPGVKLTGLTHVEHDVILNRNLLAVKEGGVDSQAHRLVNKFGGVMRLVSLLKAVGHPRDRATVYKWTYPKERGGTGGVIPTDMYAILNQVARFEGIILTTEDFDPRPMAPRVSGKPRTWRD